jgi:hypothetical protein
MGHVINPISQRLGFTRFWDSTWALSYNSLKSSYSYINIENLLLLTYIRKLFSYGSADFFSRGCIFVGYKLLRT